MSEHRITYITTPMEVADQIASTLVEDGLAMCVNIVDSITSVYRWEGRVEKSNEALLIVKATTAKTDAIVKRVAEIHPYEVPEVISFDITAGNKDYLDWLSGKEVVIDDLILDEDIDVDDVDLEEEDETETETEKE